MGQRSKVDLLPDDVLGELNAKLVAGRFTGFEALEEWLAGKGFAIGKSSLHRYGSRFEEQINRLKRTSEMAKAIVAEAPDDENAMNAALTRMVQHRLFELVEKLELDGVEVDPADLPKIARAVAEIGRGSIAQLKFAAAQHDKLQAKLAQMAGELTGDAAGLALIKRVQQEAYGIYKD